MSDADVKALRDLLHMCETAVRLGISEPPDGTITAHALVNHVVLVPARVAIEQAGKLAAALQAEKHAHRVTFNYLTEEIRHKMEAHGKSMEQLVEVRNHVLDLREVIQRVHTEADVPEVNEVALRVRTIAQAALEGGGT